MQIQNAENLSHAQMREFLESSRESSLRGVAGKEKCGWVEEMLGAQTYGGLGKRERGLVRAYLEKVTGMSVAQMTRLIRAWLDTGKVREKPYQRHPFAVRYTAQDVSLLAEVDRVASVEATVRQAQLQFNRWLALEDAERRPAHLLEMLGFDYFKLLDLLAIARSRKHIEKYYGTSETGRFPERLKPINIEPE